MRTLSFLFVLTAFALVWTGARATEKKDSKMRKAYDKVKMGDSVDKIKDLMGKRGDLGLDFVPRVTEKGVNAMIGKQMRELGVNVIWSWPDKETGEVLVVGFQEDIVGFRALFFKDGKDTKVMYQFTDKKK
jgi:hypothetical protein